MYRYKYIVIEDEPLIRKNVIKKIEELNLPIDFCGDAANGMDGILLINKVLPEIIVTDIRMPVTSGLEVAKYVKENHPNSKVIILSGYSDFSFAQQAIQYGVSDYIIKPSKTEALKEALENVLIHFDAKNEQIKANIDSRGLSQEQLTHLMEEYLKANYKEDFSLSEMAAFIGFSLEYLGKVFKKTHGKSLSQYLALLRINEAKNLLAHHPELDIQQIGSLSGYKNAYYFSKKFKQHTGYTPSEYREGLTL